MRERFQAQADADPTVDLQAVTNVAEPGSVFLTAFGTAGLWIARRRQRRGT